MSKTEVIIAFEAFDDPTPVNDGDISFSDTTTSGNYSPANTERRAGLRNLALAIGITIVLFVLYAIFLM